MDFIEDFIGFHPISSDFRPFGRRFMAFAPFAPRDLRRGAVKQVLDELQDVLGPARHATCVGIAPGRARVRIHGVDAVRLEEVRPADPFAGVPGLCRGSEGLRGHLLEKPQVRSREQVKSRRNSCFMLCSMLNP